MITLWKRRFTCNNCGKQDSHLSCIKDNRDISSEFLEEAIEDGPNVDLEVLYDYEVIRQDGLIAGKRVFKVKCPSCQSKDITPIKEDNMSNVLNFYGAAIGEQYLRGFEGLGKR